jgi:hypothetical protein
VLCVCTVCCLQSTGSTVPHTDSSRSSSLTIRKVIRIVMMTNAITIIRTAIATRGRIITIVMMMETARFSISIIVITKHQSFVRYSTHHTHTFFTRSTYSTHSTYSTCSAYLLLKSSKQAAGKTLSSPSLTALACTPNLPTVQCRTIRLRYSDLLLSVT